MQQRSTLPVAWLAVFFLIGLQTTGGEWASWSPWNTCSQTCGGGTQTRARNCITGAGNCTTGDGSEEQDCSEDDCPDNGKFSSCAVAYSNQQNLCGNNSRCISTKRSFKCKCCKGYKKSKTTGLCKVSNPNKNSQYPCCGDCTYSDCNQTGQVCATDGTTYDSVYDLVFDRCKRGFRPAEEHAIQHYGPCLELGTWGTWSTCSSTCGNTGLQTRTRQALQNLTAEQQVLYPLNETISCPDTSCGGDNGKFSSCAVAYSNGQNLCGNNSRCISTKRSFNCKCCKGYKQSKGLCKVSSPNKNSQFPCCGDCTYSDCNQTGQVCATDGTTYDSVYDLVFDRCKRGFSPAKEHAIQHYGPCLELGTWGTWSTCSSTCGNTGLQTRTRQALQNLTAEQQVLYPLNETISCPNTSCGGDNGKFSSCAVAYGNGQNLCGNNSRCISTKRSFNCKCCKGYKQSKTTGLCKVSSPNKNSQFPCCGDCTYSDCNQTGLVCATDGTTYNSVYDLVFDRCKRGFSPADEHAIQNYGPCAD